MRLNKYLASCGIASRRKCDELIASGQISVNGRREGLVGLNVAPGDTVEYRGVKVTPEGAKKYLLLNKPAGYVCTCSDDKGRATVMSLVPPSPRLFPVGRLDFDSEGLLILTNDGELANRIAHPSHKVLKEYYVEVEGRVLKEHIFALKRGVALDDGFITSPAKARLVASGAISRLYITIGEGKNRQIRRMMESLGFKVLYLSRTAIGEIKLGRNDMRPGEWRELTREELAYLKSL